MVCSPVFYGWIFILVSLIIISAIVLFVKRNKNKNLVRDTYVNIEEVPIVYYSPEYRCSTKCFDCVVQKSSAYLQPSHPAKMFVGM